MSNTGENSLLKSCVNAFGFVVLACVFVWSMWHVISVSLPDTDSESPTGRKEITFVHWQLEGRSVDAMQWAAEEYMKLHPDVYVRQIGIPTGAYEHWVRTQLIGRTAPDLMEMWARDEWDSLAVRYFYPIADWVERPNPYNDGTDLEAVSWKDTYIDGMRGGYRPNLQEYYAVPLSVFTVRIYVNRDLINTVAEYLGKPAPTEPKTLAEFFQLCEDVQQYAKLSGENVVPIAGGSDTAGQFRNKYLYMGFAGLNDKLDIDLDGALNYGDIIEAVCTDKLDLVNDPYFKAGHMAMHDICRYFPGGFMAATRDMPIALFVQGRAAMMAAGSWEAGSIFLQVDGDFEVSVFDFPIAAPDNPRYGKYLNDRIGEAHVVSGFQFGLTRFSKNRDIAMDFLHFLSSREINEQLNLRLKWFPAIEGARTDDVLTAFKPRIEGLYNSFIIQHFYIGPGTQLSYDQRYPIFVESDPPTYKKWLATTGNADIDESKQLYEKFVDDWREGIYRELMSGYRSDYRRLALQDFSGILERSYHNMHTTEANIAAVRAEAIQSGQKLGTGRVTDHIRSLIHGQATKTLWYHQDRDSFDRVEQILKSGDGDQEANQ